MATKTTSKSNSAAKRKPTSTPPTAASNTVLVAAIKPEPTHDAIASRAFELYQKRDHHDGNELSDWLAAERELT